MKEKAKYTKFEERMISDVDYIKNNMATKTSILIMRWAIGGIGAVALTALLITARTQGGI